MRPGRAAQGDRPARAADARPVARRGPADAGRGRRGGGPPGAGRVQVNRGEVVGVEGARFRRGDRVTGADSWEAKSLMIRKVAAKKKAAAKKESSGPSTFGPAITPNGVLVTLRAPADATLRVETGQGGLRRPARRPGRRLDPPIPRREGRRPAGPAGRRPGRRPRPGGLPRRLGRGRRDRLGRLRRPLAARARLLGGDHRAAQGLREVRPRGGRRPDQARRLPRRQGRRRADGRDRAGPGRLAAGGRGDGDRRWSSPGRRTSTAGGSCSAGPSTPRGVRSGPRRC